MELQQIHNTNGLPNHLQAAAKIGLSVGAAVFTATDNENLLAKFDSSDHYYFDPQSVTMHALEALDNARRFGLVAYRDVALGTMGTEFESTDTVSYRNPLVIRVVHSLTDVRVQIGASAWFASQHTNTAAAMRAALSDAFCAYYDNAIAPHTET